MLKNMRTHYDIIFDISQIDFDKLSIVDNLHNTFLQSDADIICPVCFKINTNPEMLSCGYICCFKCSIKLRCSSCHKIHLLSATPLKHAKITNIKNKIADLYVKCDKCNDSQIEQIKNHKCFSQYFKYICKLCTQTIDSNCLYEHLHLKHSFGMNKKLLTSF